MYGHTFSYYECYSKEQNQNKAIYYVRCAVPWSAYVNSPSMCFPHAWFQLSKTVCFKSSTYI